MANIIGNKLLLNETTDTLQASGGFEVVGTVAVTGNALEGKDSATDDANKSFRIVIKQYDNEEEGILAFIGTSTVDASTVAFGYGSSLYNASTVLKIGTSLDSKTTTGIERFRIDNMGGVGINSLAADSAQRFSLYGARFGLVYYFNGSTYSAVTTESRTTRGTPYNLLAATNNFFYIGQDTGSKFNQVYMQIATPGVGITLVAEYWNGSAWTALTVTDGTTNLTTSGTIAFTPPTDWVANTVNTYSRFWVRLSTSSAPSTTPTAYLTLPDARDPFGIYANYSDASPIFLIDKSGATNIGGPTNYISVAQGGHVTLNGTATVFDDLNFDPSSSGGPAATLPDYVTINNVVHREFTSANNQLCGDGEELPHSYKLSSTIFPHIHVFLKSGESAGTTGVTFTFYWELRQTTGTTSGSVTLSATTAQLGTTAGANKLDIYDSTGFAGPAELGGQLTVKIARTAGDAGDIVVTTYGVHYEMDSIGSNAITSKT